MTTNASRATVDFDAFARDLQQPPAPAQVPVQGVAPVQAPAAAKADPLAELARIVGQDDPFRAILSGDKPPSHRLANVDDIFTRREPL